MIEVSDLCEGTLKGDGGGFKVFYIFADTESFTDDAEVDFCSVVRCDDGRWVGFTVQIPPNQYSSSNTRDFKAYTLKTG